MRSYLRLGLIVLLAASAGCDLPPGPTGTGGSTNNGQGTQGTMNATIANVPWTANGRVTATYATAQNGVGASVLNLSGQDAPLTRTITIAIGSLNLGTALSPGTFQVGTTATNATLTDGQGNTFQASGPVGFGTVTLTTFNTTTRTATGSFNFVVIQTGASAQRAITNGSFSVNF